MGFYYVEGIMITKEKKIFIYVFFVIFSVCFSFILANILFGNTEYNYKTLTLILFVIISIYLLTLMYTRLSKHEMFLNQHYKTILISFLFIMLILQLSFGSMLRFQPTFDIEAIYQGSIDWMQTGSFSNYYTYFYYFPNNLGSMAFLHFIFVIASFFRFKDYTFVAIIINSILSVSTMSVVFLTCRRILGVKQAIFSLLLFAVSLPFYFIAPVFYTDALSMLFPILYYYLYLRWKDSSNFKNRCLLFGLMGIVASIGMLVKFTVIIMVIAVTIDMLINLDRKKAIFTNIGIYIIIYLFFAIFNGYIYSHHLDSEQARQQNDPYTHWVMMGLKGSGGYNPQDYDFTRSFTDPNERRKANIEEIKKRINEYGLNGMFDLFTRKSVRCFGDGTYSLSDFLDDRKDSKNVLHQYLIPGGNKYDLYRHICEAVLFSIMIFMLSFAFQHILGKDYFEKEKPFTKRKEHKLDTGKKYIVLGPPLSVFGIYLFLLMWETNGRYFSNFLPLIFTCATLGIDYFCVLIKHFIASIKFRLDKTY